MLIFNNHPLSYTSQIQLQDLALTDECPLSDQLDTSCVEMGNLLPKDRDIIDKYPLDNTLNHLQDALRKAEQSYDAVDDNSDQIPGKEASGLLGTLIGSETSGHLSLRTGNREVATDLSGLRRRMQNGDFNYEHCRAVI